MNIIIGEYNYEDDLATYYEHRIMSLERKRMKIVCRGKLSPAEDCRLNEIDSEVIHLLDCLDALIDYSDGEDDM